MKIALVINELNIKGGTHKQLIRLASYLALRNHDVKIFTKKYSAELYPSVIKDVQVISYENAFKDLWAKPVKYVRAFYGSIKMGREIGGWADVINIHDNWLLIPNIYIKVFAPTKKVVWQINDVHPVFAIGNSVREDEKWYYKFVRSMNRWVAKKNDAITVNVTKNKERVKSIFGCDATVIYCGVDLKNQNVTPRLVDRDKTIRLLSVGVFFRYRNYETVLKVHEQLVNTYGLDVETTLVGSTKLDPAYAAEIEAMIVQKGLKAKVLGQVTDAEIDVLFKQSHFFMFLNIDQSWGLAVFEAMNYGLPVILSESVGAVELLEDSNAYIVNPLDEAGIAKGINNLAADEEKYNKIALNAFNSVSSMTWDNMYSKNVEAIFLKLLNQSIPA